MKLYKRLAFQIITDIFSTQFTAFSLSHIQNTEAALNFACFLLISIIRIFAGTRMIWLGTFFLTFSRLLGFLLRKKHW
ncbi:hypothetical protein L1987_78359 [Smallanthus sonchifolius]|uniref:Uncharacterized protein n=1 Tax=Smallanthus sonchifolius TaxID=185202 RepID=A0ACB8ZCP1_9ASTR|nr:hypothetical protein L1987_78359 [Smallanthus sonchifolius]